MQNGALSLRFSTGLGEQPCGNDYAAMAAAIHVRPEWDRNGTREVGCTISPRRKEMNSRAEIVHNGADSEQWRRVSDERG